MADEPNKTKWYQTAPGYLTATAALVGSITAAVTGLSQLGIFHKDPTPTPVVAPAPVAASTHASPERGNSGSSSHRTEEHRSSSTHAVEAPVKSSGATATPPAAAAAPAPAPTAAPTAAPAAPPPAPPPVAKTGSIGPGTTIELSSGSRVCSTSSKEGDKFTATTNSAVSGSNGVSLPAGSQVILSVVIKKAPQFIGANGVSIDVAGKAVKIEGTASAQTEVAAGLSGGGFGIGACIPQGGRVSLRLTDGVAITQ